MKSFCLFLFIGIVFADNIDDQLVAFSQECRTATGVDKDLVFKLKGHDFSSDDPALKVRNY